MNTQVRASTSARNASHIRKYGHRYYPVDESYDKNVYENDFANYMKIVGALLLFWFFNALHWLGILSLGIVKTDILAWYSIGCFLFTVIFLAIILISGRYANAIKREYEFLIEKIAEKKAEEKEASAKIEQQAAHEEKIRQQAVKIAELKREAEAKAAEEAAALAAENAPTAMAPAPAATSMGYGQQMQGFVQNVSTNIQDNNNYGKDSRLLMADSRQ